MTHEQIAPQEHITVSENEDKYFVHFHHEPGTHPKLNIARGTVAEEAEEHKEGEAAFEILKEEYPACKQEAFNWLAGLTNLGHASKIFEALERYVGESTVLPFPAKT